MLMWFEEAGVELAMLVATVTATAVFIWAAGTMLVRWMRYSRAESVALEPASRTARAAVGHTTDAA